MSDNEPVHIPMLQFVAETRLKKYAEVEMLVAKAILHHGITDPADLAVCESLEGGVHRLWVEVRREGQR